MAKFSDIPLRLINPAFTSPLLDVLTDLEYLRRLQLSGSTPLPIFLQLKRLFHLLESLASARIEGNHTTLSDYVETRIADREQSKDEAWNEIQNVNDAMQFIETEMQPSARITQQFVRELHALTVRGLTREGDKTPGAYRLTPVRIAQADHLPPEAIQVPSYMEELIDFINYDDPSKYDLIKIALAHHRFSWIHPFGNGNGRVVRLLTYAMLVKFGFQVHDLGGLLNPAAVFCADRERYYAMLSQADEGSEANLEKWCSYVLTGVRDEMKKIEKLAHYDYLTTKILLPALAFARDREHITSDEYLVLFAAINAPTGVIKAGDLSKVLPKRNSTQRTYLIQKLLKTNMLQPIRSNARQYHLGFANTLLIRGVVRALRSEGFISDALAGEARQ
jgi:Fic family protein